MGGLERLLKSALNWIETGDLILPVVVVSAAHYAIVLSAHDFWFIAFVIGVLVDLGHYRIVKAAIRFGKWFWFAALIMTMLAFGFHLAFYGDNGDWREWMYSAAIPIVIVFLAALSVRERWAAKATSGDKHDNRRDNDAPPAQTVAPPAQTVAPSDETLSRAERLDAIRRVNVTRNGDGPMTAEQIVAAYGVSLRQAQRDVAQLAKMVIE